jgi:hypothetical protein
MRYGETNMQIYPAEREWSKPDIVAPDKSVCQYCKVFMLRAERVKVKGTSWWCVINLKGESRVSERSLALAAESKLAAA